MRFHLVEEEALQSVCVEDSRSCSTHSGHPIVGPLTPLSLYQASYRGRDVPPSPNVLDDSAADYHVHGGGGLKKQRVVKSRSLTRNPRHAVSTRDKTLDELLLDNLKAVQSCTPLYKHKHLRHTPPLPSSSTSQSRLSSPLNHVRSVAASPVLDEPPVSSTYRDSFAPSCSSVPGTKAAGKLLQRDPVDNSTKPPTEISLSRASYLTHSVEAYGERSKTVARSYNAVQQRFDDATAYARRSKKNNAATDEQLVTLHQASYSPPPPGTTAPSLCNPDLARTAASLRERSQPGFFDMDVTSTQRGDYSIVPQLKKAAAAARGAPSPLRRALSTTPPPNLCGPASALSQVSHERGAAPAAVLSRALESMSTELADPPAYRAQSSCEMIPQRSGQFPGAAIHVPVAQLTGPDVINRRSALDDQHRGLPAGSSRGVAAAATTMHTCSNIFGTTASSTGESVSRASYQPFRFV